jgi:predicted nuclease with RNAse H fold
VKTLGIDLAASDSRTAACLIHWNNEQGMATTPKLGLSDDSLLEAMGNADKVAIDSPFGWPDHFVEAVSSYAGGGPWPATDRRLLRYRATDQAISQGGRPPLSVSSDLIAVTAMRCALLLTRLALSGTTVDRSGSGLVVEAYPAAALRAWGFKPGRYKEAGGRETRALLVSELVERCTPWLSLSEDCIVMCEVSDHALDALICALVARASAIGATRDVPDGLRARALREGWIHIPTEDSWTRLSSRGRTD